MIRWLLTILFFLPTVLFLIQWQITPFPELMETDRGLVLVTEKVRAERRQEEWEGARKVQEEVRRQAASISFSDGNWRDPGSQAMFLICMRRPDGAGGDAAKRQARCQCLAQASLVAENRSQMRYLVLTGLMTERIGLLKVRLADADIVDKDILEAVALDKATARALLGRVNRSSASC